MQIFLSYRRGDVGGHATVDQLVSYMKEAWSQVGVKMEIDSVEGVDGAVPLVKVADLEHDRPLGGRRRAGRP